MGISLRNTIFASVAGSAITLAASAALANDNDQAYKKLDNDIITTNTQIDQQALLIENVINRISQTHFLAPNEDDLRAGIYRHFLSQLSDPAITNTPPSIAAANALNAILDNLDPHSGFLSADELRAMRESTNSTFEGIGVRVTLDYTPDDNTLQDTDNPPTLQRGLLIEGVISDDAPAAIAGLQADDLITHVGNTALAGKTTDEATSLIRGPINTSVTLTIERSGEANPLEIDVTRGNVRISPVIFELVDNTTGHIRVRTFNEQTDYFVDQAIRTLTSQGATEFILDLRFNPGGLLPQADEMIENFISGDPRLLEIWQEQSNLRVQMATEQNRNREPGQPFIWLRDVVLPPLSPEDQAVIDNNITISIRDNSGKYPQYFVTPDQETDAPLVVLLNGYSASASEIVAGALQDHGRAVVIGTQSYGKGSVQTVMPLLDSNRGLAGALRLTTSLYYVGRGEGHSIQGVGITPDIRLSDAFEYVARRQSGEADLDGSISAPTDSNLTTESHSECVPIDNTAASINNPEVECALAYFRGGQTDNVRIVPLINDPAPAPAPALGFEPK
ncbi:MAG: S41 family peptidase [Alphaproteobacteria bacterium]